MPRMSAPSNERIRELTAQLALDVTDTEVKSFVERHSAMADFYELLESTPDPGRRSDPDVSDRFDRHPYRPTDDEDPHNAWITRFELDRPDAESDVLDGVTVGLKDNICVRGVELTCGSLAFEGVVSGAHADVTERLLDAGARIMGKTNMDELAFAPTGETSAFGPASNPVDTDHVPGGSSSGSAAAVAAGEVDLTLGSDTGGSVRIPASYCGIVGLKPTYGLIPRRGFVDLAYSLDHIGPMARDVETVARGLSVLADSPPDGSEPAYVDDLGVDLSTITIGVSERFFETYVSDAVERTVRDAIDAMGDLGATIRAVDIPALDHSRPAWWGIAPAEFAASYATNGVGFGRRNRVDPTLVTAISRVRTASSGDLGRNVKGLLLLGAHLNRTYNGYHYVRGQNLRADLTEEFNAVFKDVDVLATPSTPTTALELGGFERGVTPPINWNTHPTDLTGHPSISVPSGTVDGLPVGLQFIGPWYGEQIVLDVAHAHQEQFDN